MAFLEKSGSCICALHDNHITTRVISIRTVINGGTCNNRWHFSGKAKFITPFVGAQKDICEVFGFAIPDGCGTEYRSRKVVPKHRVRPAMAKTVKLEG